MLRFISWSDYTICWTILLLVYYGVVWKFYRREIGEWMHRFGRFREATVPEGMRPAPPVAPALLPNEKDVVELFSLVHELLNDLRSWFSESPHHYEAKEELLMALQGKLKGYERIKGTAFQVAINHQLAQEAERWFGMQLEEEEVKRVWNG